MSENLSRTMTVATVTAVLLFALLLVGFAVSSNSNQDVKTVEVSGVLLDPTLDKKWQDYKVRFGKRYSGPTEEVVRRVNWEENAGRIRAHNARYRRGLETFDMALHRRSDWTRAEWKRILGPDDPEDDIQGQDNLAASTGFPSSSINRTIDYYPTANTPLKVDHRGSPCIPPVKDQDACGSCWAFAAVSPIEYRICKQTIRNVPIILSEQQLVDCSRPYGNQGCDGGYETKAWEYIMDNGITTNCTYPYVGKDQNCRYKRSQAMATVPDYSLIKPFDIATMRAVVARQGPIVVSMKVISSFLHYSSGTYYDPHCLNLAADDVNHALVVVGYGLSKDNIPYWIIRNSWGTDWGIGGYVLYRSGTNLCNIERWPSYPHAKLVNNPKSSADTCFSQLKL